MLERGLDRQPLQALAAQPPLEHNNLRGAAYSIPRTLRGCSSSFGEENRC